MISTFPSAPFHHLNKGVNPFNAGIRPSPKKTPVPSEPANLNKLKNRPKFVNPFNTPTNPQSHGPETAPEVV